MQKKFKLRRYSFVGEGGERTTFETNKGLKWFTSAKQAREYITDTVIRTKWANPVGLIIEGDYIDAPDEAPAREYKPDADDVRAYNVGASNYAKHKIQPWDIWLEYKLNPWDADIVKRVLRDKPTDGRKLDYEKIIHICKERIRQLENGE